MCSYIDDLTYRVIKDGYNTSLPVRKTLKFQHLKCTDDPINEATIISGPQCGITSAMVAGEITVTVPEYSVDTQRVIVSHAVFAGTPGILSVQQISSTQFKITSLSSTDTSTVNWYISPSTV